MVEEDEVYQEPATEAPYNRNKGLVPTKDYCRRNYIQVQQMSILCDTPGAYYYGSNAYRNSVVCMSGDKAHLEVLCKFDCVVCVFC